MTVRRSASRVWCAAVLSGTTFGLFATGSLPQALGQATVPGDALAQSAAEAVQVVTADQLSRQIWNDARTGGGNAQARRAVLSLPEDAPGALAGVRESFVALEMNLAKREEARAAKILEVNQKLDEQLAKNDADGLSEAIRLAVELWLLAEDKTTVTDQPRIAALIERADAAAREAEARGDWFTANELFFRLNVLLREQGKYDSDVKRLGQRLGMIRLYVPEQFWELRNTERLKEKKTPLPPYNGLGEDWNDRLKGVEATPVLRAILSTSRFQIDRVPMREIITGGLSALRTMITTSDLSRAFPALSEAAAREKMLGFIDAEIARLSRAATSVSPTLLENLLQDLIASSNASVKIPARAILHEFGNGAMSVLDEYTAIIWPDEMARFDRMTKGEFKGVGVQIQLDDETQMIKVVTPLEGTPAHRAGIRADDLIKKINGQSAIGISLNQAVDLITGPEGTPVSITVEREQVDIDFELQRALIPLASVKGWKRTGPADDQWDWFVDPDSRIGYVRLLQFTDDTTADLERALAQMRSGGLRGLVLDLRFNPGGLLTQAISVASTFIDQGLIVSTEGTTPSESRKAEPGRAQLRDVPVAVLINEGSASASEIVSGAIRHYADAGELSALLIGQRTFGKGSVQNVTELPPNAALKITTQYYKLPDGRVIHRKPAAAMWGVEPHLRVDMLPEQEVEALRLRQDADVLLIDQAGQVAETDKPRPDPDKLIADGIDLQLQTAVAILKARAAAKAEPNLQARLLDQPLTLSKPLVPAAQPAPAAAGAGG